MVAPLVFGRPRRLFACLPHSGEDSKAPPSRCDLSRVANIIPAYPLPFNHKDLSIQEDQHEEKKNPFLMSSDEVKKMCQSLDHGSGESEVCEGGQKGARAPSSATPSNKRHAESSPATTPSKRIRLF